MRTHGPIEEQPLGTPGIVAAGVDAEAHAVTVEYDPRLLSEDAVRGVIERLAPPGERRFEKALLRLGGRACEACALKLERKAQRLPGVRRARATFIGGVMTLTFDHTELPPEEMLRRVRQIGARVEPYAIPAAPSDEAPRHVRVRLRQLFSGERLEIVCTVLTFIFMLLGWAGTRAGLAPIYSTAFYTVAYLAGGWFGVRAGWQSLRQLTIDVDLLMVLAALGAAVVGAPFEGAMLLFLFSLSNVLQGYAIDRARRAIHSLMKLRPSTALTRRDGATVTLPIDQLAVGDIVIVRPGESIALDSIVVEGESAIDQASITGESIPVAKRAGDAVFAGTINQTGGLEVRVTRLAKDSTIEKLIRLVEEAQAEKAETQRFLDRAEQYYAGGVIVFTLALILVPLLLGAGSFGQIFYRAMTVMVVASPCALFISTPASILSAIGGAARRGVLFKGGVHLENTAGVRVVAFDKTGTLTEGRPRVTDIVALGEMAQNEVLRLAAAVEAKSEHPLAASIVQESQRRGLASRECTEFRSVSGKGASALLNGRRIAIGSARFFAELLPANDTIPREIEKLQDAGKTCVLVGELPGDGRTAVILGAIGVADVLRPDACAVVQQLRAIGIERVVMLTGDNPRVARSIAHEVGVDEFHAELLPEDKVRVVRSLREIGPVAMVGDGVNDAPALAAANVGIAMGAAGTDVAMETADVVLMSNELARIPFAIALSRRARRVVFQNLAFSLTVIVILVAAALGFALPLPLGVIGHEGSTVLVCLNGLRLLGFRWAAE